MKNSTAMRHAMKGFLGALALTVALSASASAQEASSTSYRRTGRDPFTKVKVVVKKKVEKKVPTQVAPPPIQARIDQYKAKKLAAMNLQQPAPKPTTALLLNEVQVTGIFRTPRGYAAMIEATPIKLSYVIYPGENFYDGMLVAIEESRLVFRREARWTDGRRDVTVETKPLRQPNAVTDSLTEAKTAGASTTGGSPEGGNGGGGSVPASPGYVGVGTGNAPTVKLSNGRIELKQEKPIDTTGNQPF